jgi:hypothetical protein
MKTKLGPFPELQNIKTLETLEGKETEITECCTLINSTLAALGCNCNGHNHGKQRDEYWAHDLNDIVRRSAPHNIVSTDMEGVKQTHSVSVKLPTLRVEVDDNMEVCAWIYEES